LMSAFYFENRGEVAGLDQSRDQMFPPCPWEDQETALRRDREVQKQLERPVGGESPRCDDNE
jgi:hypothetical protein